MLIFLSIVMFSCLDGYPYILLFFAKRDNLFFLMLFFLGKGPPPAGYRPKPCGCWPPPSKAKKEDVFLWITTFAPLSVCVAMSRAYIGYGLQNALREELLNRGIKKSMATVITQVRVDENDPAFLNPTKLVRHFVSQEEALEAQNNKIPVVEAPDGGTAG